MATFLCSYSHVNVSDAFKCQERLHVIEQSESDMNVQRAMEAKRKTEQVMILEETAKRRREQDVNDSTMVCCTDVSRSWEGRCQCSSREVTV